MSMLMSVGGKYPAIGSAPVITGDTELLLAVITLIDLIEFHSHLMVLSCATPQYSDI